MRRHLRWFVPVVLACATYIGASLAVAGLGDGLGENDTGRALALLGLAALAVVGPIVCLVFAARGAFKTFREHQRSRGRFTRSERAALELRQQSDTAWEHAQVLRRQLVQGVVPPTLQTWDIVANPGEVFFLDAPVTYSRYYGQDIAYTQTSGFYYGRPSFVLTGLAFDALSNRARRSAAAAQAAAQWREHQVARLLVSNHRLICHAGGRWLSFYFGGMTAVYPDAAQWALVAQFHDTEPLMLHGRCVPAVSALTLLMTHGKDAVENHPGLQALAR
ncbi:hypothetical protein ABE437_04690 [Isoptericola cucumis]|uniref:hypothetical protein n=1 Tax=Isoptericola cucumis TaxID=1776856 RepID=UPI003207F214